MHGAGQASRPSEGRGSSENEEVMGRPRAWGGTVITRRLVGRAGKVKVREGGRGGLSAGLCVQCPARIENGRAGMRE